VSAVGSDRFGPERIRGQPGSIGSQITFGVHGQVRRPMTAVSATLTGSGTHHPSVRPSLLSGCPRLGSSDLQDPAGQEGEGDERPDPVVSRKTGFKPGRGFTVGERFAL
jgi:hypothetical protein